MSGSAVDPTLRRTRESLAGPLLLAGAGASAVVALRLRDPHDGGSWGLCPFLHLSGWYCPLCGGLRAVHDLTFLDVAAAVSSNVLVVLLLPVAALLWGSWVMRLRRGAPAGRILSRVTGNGRRLSVLLVGLAFAFGVVRNLPAGSWLAP